MTPSALTKSIVLIVGGLAFSGVARADDDLIDACFVRLPPPFIVVDPQ